MIYTEAVDYIHSLLKFGVRPGLSGMNTLLHFLGNPHKNMKFIHIAGTNGKGSTSTAISNVLICAGYNVGLYTSPFVTHFLERVQFNGVPVDENIFAESVTQVKNGVEALNENGVVITEFEALTAAAFLCFKKLNCDAIVLEVGLGGRLDATNVINTPLVNVITSLSLDHTGVLGETIEEIAFEKCGTIKEGSKVICSFGQPENALDVIKKTVKNKHASLVIPDKEAVKIIKSDLYGNEFRYKDLIYKTKLTGLHQLKNMTCVIEVCEKLKTDFIISRENIVKGIFETTLPARVEILSRNPLVILDGGHNEDGARAFFGAVNGTFSKFDKIYVLAGMMGDKAVESSLKPLFLKATSIITVTPENPRAMSCEKLGDIARKYCEKVCSIPSAVDGVRYVFKSLKRGDAFFCVGSLYLAGEIREELTEILKKFD